jgi:alkylresorcinol/alkylpyrone synthase/polyketide synthase Type III
MTATNTLTAAVPLDVRTPPPAPPLLLGIGSAASRDVYTQAEVLDYFGVTDPRIRSLFLNSAIERRHLTLPGLDPDGTPHAESQGELLRKHSTQGVAMGAEAVRTCLASTGLALSDVDYLCCVTTTGLLAPGLSALLVPELGLREDVGRLDVVGMGCNAGLSALRAVAAWSAANPGGIAVLACIEVCSAAYVFDDSIRTAVVNSIFGDGAVAVAVGTRPGSGAPGGPGVTMVKFASHIIADAADTIRFDWDDAEGKYSFYLSPDVPYIIGAHADTIANRLLADTGLRRSDITHWVVHSGGKKVVDSVRVNLGLTRHDVRHTMNVLRDHGNISSGSFLLSYELLLAEGITRPGEYGVLMAMGPGATIETALVRF